MHIQVDRQMHQRKPPMVQKLFCRNKIKYLLFLIKNLASKEKDKRKGSLHSGTKIGGKNKIIDDDRFFLT
jgi:hypothetical protein